MRKFLFPYDSVKKNSNIILYGAGDVASQFLDFINQTGYCKIVAVLDKNHEEKDTFPIKVLPPEAITIFATDDYSTVLIAISDRKSQLGAKQKLTELEVPEGKILLFDNKLISYDNTDINKILLDDDGGDSLRIAVVSVGGLGDDLISSLLLQSFRNVVGVFPIIDYYCGIPNLFLNMPFISNNYYKHEYTEENDYDVVLTGGNFFRIEKVKLEKVQRFSLVLYQYLLDMLWHYENIFSVENSVASSKLLQYCMILGKNRIEQMNVHDILPFDRHTQISIELKPEHYRVFNQLKLEGVSYITLCDSVSTVKVNSSKLWPHKYFNKLVSLIKENYPQIPIVCVGETSYLGEIEKADHDMRCRTSLYEMMALLKHSVLHIGCEGGLVHLKHFLGGSSVCLFGPTAIEMYGYEENINLRSNVFPNCRSGCEWIKKDWVESGCLLDMESKHSKCMETLYPKTVFEKIAEFLDRLGFRQSDN